MKEGASNGALFLLGFVSSYPYGANVGNDFSSTILRPYGTKMN